MQDKVRRQLDNILAFLDGKGHVSVQTIMEEFSFSKSTANRYLNLLEQENKIKRAYGGVTSNQPNAKEVDFETSVEKSPDLPINEVPSYLRKLNPELLRVGRRAAGLVEDGDIILIGTGRTCFVLYTELKAKGVVAFTNSLFCAAYQNPNVSHIYVMGGEVLEGNAVLGSLGIENLGQISPQKIFFSATAITDRLEIQYKSDMERQYVEAVLRMDGEKIFLIDSSKLKTNSGFKMNCLDEIDTIITDIQFSPEDLEVFQQMNVKIISV